MTRYNSNLTSIECMTSYNRTTRYNNVRQVITLQVITKPLE